MDIRRCCLSGKRIIFCKIIKFVKVFIGNMCKSRYRNGISRVIIALCFLSLRIRATELEYMSENICFYWIKILRQGNRRSWYKQNKLYYSILGKATCPQKICDRRRFVDSSSLAAKRTTNSCKERRINLRAQSKSIQRDFAETITQSQQSNQLPERLAPNWFRSAA